MSSLQVMYRPKNFDDVVGNKATILSLKKVLQREQPPSAFLITGPSGTGKTTLGRIISDALHCSPSDYTELDASSDRGIDATRALADSMRYMPLSGSKKVILLDEAHMLTKPAQESLLKSLEEPPKHVHWIICTTNPEALKDTLKRRCHIYHLQRVIENDMRDLLKKIIIAEKRKPAQYPASVMLKLIQVADGSPGIALKMLDQILDLTSVDDMMNIIESIGYSDDSVEIGVICKILADSKMTDEELRWKKLMPLLKGLDIDPESGRRVVLSWMEKTLLSTGSARVAGIIHNFKGNFYDSGKAGFVLACYLSCVTME